MNDDPKLPNLAGEGFNEPSSDGGPPPDEDEGGERTVAMSVDAAELANAPSPISNAPPAPNPPAFGTATLKSETGAALPSPPTAPRAPVGPPRPAAPRPGSSPGRMPVPPPPSGRMAGAQRPGTSPMPFPAAPPPAPASPASPAEPPDIDGDPPGDGPTMASAPGALAGMYALDEGADARPSGAFGSIPEIGGDDNDGEDEATRAVPREELLRHQDAQFVVGADALGDEATLAVPAPAVPLGMPAPPDAPSPGAPSPGAPLPPAIATGSHSKDIASALAESLGQGPAPQNPAPDPPAFPPPPSPFGAAASSGHLPAAPGPSPFGAAPSGHSPAAPNLGAPYPPQGQQPAPPWPAPMGLQPAQGMPPGPMPQPGQGYAMGPQGYPMQGGPMPPGFGAPQGFGPPQGVGAPSPRRVSSQVLLLVGVGVVCLAIFVIGIVLFVTTQTP